MGRLFDDLKDGLNEMIAYKEGKITLRSEIIEVAEPPMECVDKEIDRPKLDRKKDRTLG